VLPAGNDTDGLPFAVMLVEAPILLMQPPIVPLGALFEHGQSVQPSWLPPSPLQRVLIESETQMPPELHQSSVFGLPSSQSRGVPTQTPPMQVSLTVQGFPSSQGVPSKAHWAEAKEVRQTLVTTSSAKAKMKRMECVSGGGRSGDRCWRTSCTILAWDVQGGT